MAQFATAEDVHEQLGKLLRSIAADPELSGQAQRLDAVVQLQLTDPEAQLALRAREGQPVAALVGETAGDADVVLELEADVAHALFLGQLELTGALAGGRLRTKGPAAKVLRVFPLAKAAAPRYQQVLDGEDVPLGEAPAPAEEAPGAEAPEAQAAEAPAEGAAPEAVEGAEADVAEGDARAAETPAEVAETPAEGDDAPSAA
ncbi:SCP2 sterol-binding domain-containing protein [Conexibacter sp. SYSU D00693]|uniref:SCP2 sterol-binding domain-containing protein n=1 Tax=Conexibacter sp. SYSU D00693 TaxID=2812560 RepID=UPI00196A79AF|nr:SCP2 sterol-binding domain-containing protein [Conexibacter sp. SYSU D00693]